MLGRAEDLPLAGLLDEGNDPQISWIGAGVEFEVNILGETLTRLDAANFGQTLYHAHVGQAAAAIFAAQHLRLGMIQRRHQINIRLANFRVFGQRIRVDVCLERFRSVERDPGNLDRNLRRRESFLNRLAGQPRFAAHKLGGAIDDHLRGVDAAQSETVRVGVLALAEKAGRVRIGPSNVIPVIHMFAEHDQLGSAYGLCTFELLQHLVSRRTTGATLRSKQLDQDRRQDRCRAAHRTRI